VLVPIAGVALTTIGVMLTHPLWRLRSQGR
jgi:hypothetical protein